MRRRLLLALALGVFLAGCGGSETVSPSAETVVGTVPGEVDLSQGDPEAGEEIFSNVANPACGTCHTFEAAGSDQTLGPDLDEVLADQDREAVYESIVDPSAEISEGFTDLMPKDYDQQLDEQQLADLVAFLKPQS